MVNFAKEKFNELASFANEWGASIQPLSMTDLIDTSGLSMQNAEIINLLTDGAEDNINTLGDFATAQGEIYKKYIDQIVVLNEEVEASDNKLTDNKKKKAEITKEFGNVEVAAIGKMSGALAQLNDASRGSALVSGRLAQAQAIADTYAGANKAFAQGGVAGFITGSAIIASGLANVVNISRSLGDIKAAATGMNEVVTKPTMILAGEAGAEQVSITPLNESMNINGVQGGGGMTVNVSGNIMSKDYVEGELAEQIKEAIRRGSDFGVN